MSPRVRLEFEVVSIKCNNEECKAEFVFMIVFRSKECGWNASYDSVSVLQQTGSDFCPVCGKSQKENDEIVTM